MSETKKPSKLTRKEREQIALLCRLTRAAIVADGTARGMNSLRQKLFDIEYEVREWWRLRR